MKKNVIVFLVLIVLAVAGYWWWRTQNVSPIAWSTYQNKVTGVRFDYPESFVVKTETALPVGERQWDNLVVVMGDNSMEFRFRLNPPPAGLEGMESLGTLTAKSQGQEQQVFLLKDGPDSRPTLYAYTKQQSGISNFSMVLGCNLQHSCSLSKMQADLTRIINTLSF